MLRQVSLVLFSIVLVMTSTALSADPVIAPVITAGDKAGESLSGVFIAEPTPQNPNALDIIRSDLRRLSNEAQAKAKEQGVFKSTLYRFTPESLTFFVAIGLVTANSMWLKAEGDPLAMERHILSLKDPIAHASFGAFMMTNGYYMEFKQRGVGFKNTHPAIQQRMMRRFNYEGMALGSLASSIVADLGQSGKMCVDHWIKGKEDEMSVQACNDAWKSWTARNKFTQYFPQIISLWASQAATDLIDQQVRRAFEAGSTTNFAKKLLNKEWVVKQAYKITAADVVLTVGTGGGSLAIKSIRLIGHVSKFTMFVAVDHLLISPWIYRPLNNLIRPALFDFDALAINTYWKAYDEANWDESKLKLPLKGCVTKWLFVPVIGSALNSLSQGDCEQSNLEKEIENFSTQTQQWREHLNSDVETDLAGWMELTKELLNQMEYSYKFYKTFAASMFETLNIKHRIDLNPADHELANNKSGYPFRNLPLFGVSMGQANTMGGSNEDLYLNKPQEIESRQHEHIKTVVESAKKALTANEISLTGRALEKFKSIITKLDSENFAIIAAGINDMNQILSVVPAAAKENNYGMYSNTKLFEYLIQLRNLLGNPHPIVYPFLGFTQAFAINSSMKEIEGISDFSLWSVAKKFKFSKPADLMFYKLICGKELASFDKTKIYGTSIDALSPQFDPPSMLKRNVDRKDFCESLQSSNSLYTSLIAGKPLSKYIVDNLNYDAIGNYQDQASKLGLDAWWEKSSKNAVEHEFKAFDLRFKNLVTKAQKNIFGERSISKKAFDTLNQSKYLQDSLVGQFKAETELYLQLIQRALTPKVEAPKNDRNYLVETVEHSKSDKFQALNGTTYLEVMKVSELMNSYYPLIAQEKVDFKSYVAHSKKIDTAIMDLLVATGLKTLEKPATKPEAKTTDILGELEETPTETSDNVYKDVQIKSPTLRQKVVVAAVRGLRQVESEVRRFIRMKIMLSKGLELDAAEFRADFANELKGQQESTKQRGASPRGGQ